jgi:hypothetical protein
MRPYDVNVETVPTEVQMEKTDMQCDTDLRNTVQQV